MDGMNGQNELERQRQDAIKKIEAAEKENAVKRQTKPQEDLSKINPAFLIKARTDYDNLWKRLGHDKKIEDLEKEVKAEQERKPGPMGRVAGFFGIKTEQMKKIDSLKEKLELSRKDTPSITREEKKKISERADLEAIENKKAFQNKSNAWEAKNGEDLDRRDAELEGLRERVQGGDRETIKAIAQGGVERGLAYREAAERREVLKDATEQQRKETQLSIEVDDFQGTRASSNANEDDPHNLQGAYEALEKQRDTLPVNVPQEQREQFQQEDERLEFSNRLELEKAQEDVDAARDKWTPDKQDANKAVLAAQAKWDVVESRQGAEVWNRVAGRERDTFNASPTNALYMDARGYSAASSNAMKDSQDRLQKVNSGEINTASRPAHAYTPRGFGTNQADGFRADPAITPYADPRRETRYQDFKAQAVAKPGVNQEVKPKQEARQPTTRETFLNAVDERAKKNMVKLAASTPPKPADSTAQTQGVTKKCIK